MVGRNLSDYEPRSVNHVTCIGHNTYDRMYEFRARVPEDTEVVVNFRHSFSAEGHLFGGNRYYTASGTALIPKKSSD